MDKLIFTDVRAVRRHYEFTLEKAQNALAAVRSPHSSLSKKALRRLEETSVKLIGYSDNIVHVMEELIRRPDVDRDEVEAVLKVVKALVIVDRDIAESARKALPFAPSAPPDGTILTYDFEVPGYLDGLADETVRAKGLLICMKEWFVTPLVADSELDQLDWECEDQTEICLANLAKITGPLSPMLDDKVVRRATRVLNAHIKVMAKVRVTAEKARSHTVDAVMAKKMAALAGKSKH